MKHILGRLQDTEYRQDLVLQHGKPRPLVSVSSPYLKESSENGLEILQNSVQSPYWILS